LALLAGRKLLLADDSITIQKVVALTFADEGVEVVTVSDGNEAIEKLQEITPDIVLADVFMPAANGYELCEYIKHHAKLKHIPVMLLVGSFEPFNEAEARRVGADDILTKPFQSIRRLIDKVGGLVGSRPAEDEGPTAELPHVAKDAVEPEKLTSEELEITTADTQPLPVAQRHPDYPRYEPIAAAQPPASAAPPPKELPLNNFRENQIMDRPGHELRNESALDSGEVLLDLGDLGHASNTSPDDFVLDIDFDEQELAPAFEVSPSSGLHPFVEPQLSRTRDHTSPVPTHDQFGDAQKSKREAQRASSKDWQPEVSAGNLERVTDEPGGVRPAVTPTGQISLDQLSPEVIDAIARRAVEQLSASVVQEIAWEVVPELAELLIKRKLEESQPK
jgi:CheY-like chemotaxis protein